MYKRQGLNVSRETSLALDEYAALLRKWNSKINLVAPSTISEIHRRHLEDSAQIYPHIPEAAQTVVDIGAGAGLPGIILAILAKESRPDLKFVLVESDQRKATFCRTAIWTIGLSAEVKAQRIEALDRLNADLITARALAPLSRLLEYAETVSYTHLTLPTTSRV